MLNLLIIEAFIQHLIAHPFEVVYGFNLLTLLDLLPLLIEEKS